MTYPGGKGASGVAQTISRMPMRDPIATFDDAGDRIDRAAPEMVVLQ